MVTIEQVRDYIAAYRAASLAAGVEPTSTTIQMTPGCRAELQAKREDGNISPLTVWDVNFDVTLNRVETFYGYIVEIVSVEAFDNGLPYNIKL